MQAGLQRIFRYKIKHREGYLTFPLNICPEASDICEILKHYETLRSGFISLVRRPCLKRGARGVVGLLKVWISKPKTNGPGYGANVAFFIVPSLRTVKPV